VLYFLKKGFCEGVKAGESTDKRSEFTVTKKLSDVYLVCEGVKVKNAKNLSNDLFGMGWFFIHFFVETHTCVSNAGCIFLYVSR